MRFPIFDYLALIKVWENRILFPLLSFEVFDSVPEQRLQRD